MSESESLRALRAEIEELEADLEVRYRKLSWLLGDEEPADTERGV